LLLSSPIEADVKRIRALGRALRQRGVELSAASECHGEVRGERGEPLIPNLLLVEAAAREWDALVVAGGRGAQRMVEDAFARDLIVRSQAKPIAALDDGRDVLARAGVSGFVSADAQAVARWLGGQLGIGEPPIDRRFRLRSFLFHRRESMRCEDIMKRNVECVSSNDSVQVAAQHMRDQNVGFLPVCDTWMKPVGTITDRDICVRSCAEDRVASKTKVAEAMTREVIACKPSDDISRAQELMSKHKKSRILCVGDDGKLAGVISLSDIAQNLADAGAQTLREVTTREAQPAH
jgi:CBS domain-containing protein